MSGYWEKEVFAVSLGASVSTPELDRPADKKTAGLVKNLTPPSSRDNTLSLFAFFSDHCLSDLLKVATSAGTIRG